MAVKRCPWMVLALVLAGWALPVRAMNCRVSSGTAGSPSAADVTALAAIVVNNQGAQGVCAGGACNFDGQDGNDPTVGDVAMLAQVQAAGSDPTGLCGTLGKVRLYGEIVLDSANPARVAARRAASAEPTLEERAAALVDKARELALERAKPFVPTKPFATLPVNPPPDPAALCGQTGVWPGELIVRLDPDGPVALLKQVATALGFEAQVSQLPERFVLRLPGRDALAPLSDTPFHQRLKERAGELCHLLRLWPGVAYVHPNAARRPSAVPTDPLYASHQWDMDMIRLPQARSITLGGATVGIIDTGIYTGHPEFANPNRLLQGYDFLALQSLAEDGDGRDNNPEDISAQLHNKASHGTHVAGIIAASSDNGIGISGVCPLCNLVIMRALGGANDTLYQDTDGSVDDESAAIRWGGGLSVSGVPANANPAKVLNLSLGGQDNCQPDEQSAIDAVHALNVVVVAAAGNTASAPDLDAPAKCNHVISVGSVDTTKALSSFTTKGLKSLMAPGNSVVSTTRTGTLNGQSTYGTQSGTSQATPHVSGVIALMQTVNPNLTADEVYILLVQTAEDLGPAGPDQEYGQGLIDAYKAVLAAQGLSPADPQPVSDVSSFDFGTATTQLTALVQHIHQDPITVTSIQSTMNTGSGWLSATATAGAMQVNGQTVPTITVTAMVNRSGLPLGTYTGTVTLVTNVGTLSLPVNMENGNPMRVRVLNASQTQLAQQSVSVGSPAFAFGGLDAGQAMVLVAEEDADGDGTYCESGEYCGYYNVSGYAGTFGGATQLTGNADQSLGGLKIILRR